jgi:hypothetical protein
MIKIRDYKQSAIRKKRALSTSNSGCASSYILTRNKGSVCQSKRKFYLYSYSGVLDYSSTWSFLKREHFSSRWEKYRGSY